MVQQSVARIELQKRLADDRIEALNRLIEACEDGVGALETAKARVASDAVAARLAEYAEQQNTFLWALVDRVQTIGGLASGGGMRGALRRTWLDFRALIDTSDAALMDHCLTQEMIVLRAYGEAMSAPLDVSTRKLVERQANDTRKIVVFLQALRVRAEEKSAPLSRVSAPQM